MMPISGVAGAESCLPIDGEPVVAEHVSRRKGKAMSWWSFLEALVVLALGFMGGWALVVVRYSALHGLPAITVAGSSVAVAAVGSLIAAFAGVGCASLSKEGVWTITGSGIAELTAILTSFTASALGLHAALWLVS